MLAGVEMVAVEQAPEQLSGLLATRRADDGVPAPCSVIVGSRTAAVLVRRQIARRTPHGIVGVTFETLGDLARRLGEPSLLAEGRARLSRPVLAGALRSVLRRHPGSLAAVVEHGSTEEALVAAYEDLAWARPAALRALAMTTGRPGEVGRWCLAAHELLAPRFFDDADLCAEAARLASEPGRGAGEIGEVICYLPERLRPRELDLLAALSSLRSVRIVLARSGDLAADRRIERLAERLVGAACAADAAPRDEVLSLAAPLRPDEVRVASDPALEVRGALASVLAALERGVPPERCAVLCASLSTYLPLLEHAFAHAGLTSGDGGIVWNGPSWRSLATSRAALVLSRLFAIAEHEVIERRALLGFFTAVHRGTDGAASFGAFDRASRLAGVVGGTKEQWRWQLEAAMADAQEIGDEATAGECKALGDAVEELGRLAALLRSEGGWRHRAELAAAALERYLADLELDACERDGHRRVLEVLTTLAGLEDVDRPPSLAEFAGAFGRATRHSVPSHGRPGSGVLVGALDAGLGASFELVVVLGAAEGNLPGPEGWDSLLPTAVRAQVQLDVGPVVEVQRRRFALALAGAERALVSYASHDGRARQPSRWLAGSPVRPLSAGEQWEGPEDDSRPVMSREATCLALAASEAEERSALLAGLGLASSAEALAARGGQRFGPYSGDLGGLGLVPPRLGSATALEQYAVCPFRYFVRSILGCEVLEEPEDRLTIEPRDRGTLVHEVLQRFVAEQLRSIEDVPAPAAGSAERLVEIAQACFRRFERRGRTGKAVLWEHERRQILRWLEDERRAIDERRCSGVEPLAVEYGFGYGSEPPISWPAGRVPLEFRGRIDRIDRAADGALEVIDYKTGSPEPYRGLRSDPVNRGKHLQLPIYALAARGAFGPEGAPVRAAYRMIGRVRDEFVVTLDEETQKRCSEVLAVIVGGIEAGVFPMRPGPKASEDFEHCRFCDYRGLCPGGRRRQWESARRDERLAPYVAMVEEEEAP